jgi:Na+-transporting NADH:ubiquinone oxidoreductase subunit C
VYSNRYIIIFTILMCSLISFILAGTSSILKDKQMFNKKMDMQKNILLAAGLVVNDFNEIEPMFNKLVQSMNISSKGEIIHTQNEDLNQKSFQLYSIKSKNNLEKISAYVYPIVGKGLWSTLYGYLSVSPSGNEIIGLTFYKHTETPGLGAEIEKKWFRQNFVGKKLYKNKKFRGITIAKGKAKNEKNYKTDYNYIVDGISGATITSKGVEKMLTSEPLKYHRFFNK